MEESIAEKTVQEKGAAEGPAVEESITEKTVQEKGAAERSAVEESAAGRFDLCMRRAFGLEEADVKEYSPLALAYIGDAVYGLAVKTLVVHGGNRQVHKLHEETSRLVQASAQSKMMRVLQEALTEEEHAVYKRGRNTKSVSPAKNQSVTDYRRATGFEAVIGYLYLKKEWDRMFELIRMGLKSMESMESGE